MRFVVLLLIVLVFSMGCVKVHGLDGQVLEIERGEAGLSAVEKTVVVTEKLLKAQVKGSIYESGESVSVFGTCLDEAQLPIANTTATFTAWYPNGTKFINETNVSEIQPGYFLYTAPMEPVQGTYLTQLRCVVGEQFAIAWGEWQNPFWVARINSTEAEVLENQALLENLTIDVEEGFNETFVQINQTQVLINESTTVIIGNISYAAEVANASVDRNDSYIVQLIQQIINNGTPSTGPAGSVSFTEEFSDVVFFETWEITVTAFIGSTQVGSDFVSCFINTTNAPPTDSAQLEPIDGPKFTYSEVVHKLDDFDWDVWCEEN